MPVCYKNDNENFTLGLWHIVENDIQLFETFSQMATAKDIEKAKKFKYPARKSEWMATRLLLYHLLNEVVEIEYDINGKPYLLNQNRPFSISHTKGMVAVIISKNIAGIDVEIISNRVLRIEDKFMSNVEKKQIAQDKKAQLLLTYWSAKETLYKIYGDKGLDFKKNIYIRPFEFNDKGEFTAEIVKNNQTSEFNLTYFIYNEMHKSEYYLIVYCHS